MNIDELPYDVLLRVVTFIPYKDIVLQVSLVCTLFNDITSHSDLWKLLFQQDFQVDLKSVQEPDNWPLEFTILHNYWNAIIACGSMKIDPDFEQMIHLEIKGGIVQVTNKLTESPGDIINVQCRQPFMPLPKGDFSCGYFEITMKDGSDEQRIGMGLARNDYAKAMPGWRKGSCGYHADDGRFFISLEYGRDLTDPWKNGDICGCGVDFRRNNIFFTKNGALLSSCPFPYITLGLYVTIGTQRKGETVEVNLGGKPFTFDILKYQRELQESAPFSELTVPYSKLAPIFNERPRIRKDRYEDLEYQDRYLAKDEDMSLFCSLEHLLSTFPDDSSSYKDKVNLLLKQMESDQISVPADISSADLRATLVNFVNGKKLLRMLRLVDTPAHLNMLDALFDQFSAQVLKCINVLSFNYPPDHIIVCFTYNVLKELGLQLPTDTIANRRTYCRYLLNTLDRNLLQLKAKRRESLRKLNCFNPTYYYYHGVDDLVEDIDANENYDKQMQEYPFTPRQQAVLEHIADCVANKELSDEDPLVTTAIAQCYFEFRKSMPFVVDVPVEREKLAHFLAQVLA